MHWLWKNTRFSGRVRDYQKEYAISLQKTEALSVSTVYDATLRFRGTGLQFGRQLPIHLYYQDGLIQLVQFFIYICVHLH